MAMTIDDDRDDKTMRHFYLRHTNEQHTSHSIRFEAFYRLPCVADAYCRTKGKKKKVKNAQHEMDA